MPIKTNHDNDVSAVNMVYTFIGARGRDGGHGGGPRQLCPACYPRPREQVDNGQEASTSNCYHCCRCKYLSEELLFRY